MNGPRPLVQNLLDHGERRFLDLDVVEVFAGVGASCEHLAICTEAIHRGWHFFIYEGFDLVACCSSFTFLNMYTSGRDALLPEGLQCRPTVRLGNLLAKRSFLIMRLARAMKIFTLLEQPAHNTTGGMENLSRFRDMDVSFDRAVNIEAKVDKFRIHMDSVCWIPRYVNGHRASDANESSTWPNVFAASDEDYDLQGQISVLFSEPIDWQEDVFRQHLTQGRTEIQSLEHMLFLGTSTKVSPGFALADRALHASERRAPVAQGLAE
ncbi:unnamed protein product [Symbiodinium sp. CCMP2592]|nr:unnamed protein product [Symbiodinium sp. CCMP2592]